MISDTTSAERSFRVFSAEPKMREKSGRIEPEAAAAPPPITSAKISPPVAKVYSFLNGTGGRPKMEGAALGGGPDIAFAWVEPLLTT